MQKTVTRLFMAIFILGFAAAIVYTNYVRPRILVLHSYGEDYIWTRDVNVGLDRIFRDQSWVDIRYHYMHTKKFKKEDDLRRASIAAKQAVDKIRPDVLIAIDDSAQQLVAMQYNNDPYIKIVFAGINGSIEPYGYHLANNVTGILERKPVGAIREMITFLGSLDESGADEDALVAEGRLPAARQQHAVAEGSMMLAPGNGLETVVQSVAASDSHTELLGKRAQQALEALQHQLGWNGAGNGWKEGNGGRQSLLFAGMGSDVGGGAKSISGQLSADAGGAGKPKATSGGKFRAVFLGDSSHSVERDAEHLEAFNWSPVVYQGSIFVDVYEDWQEKVLGIHEIADYLLVGGYRKLHRRNEKEFVSAEEVMEWTSANSPVPVIGMNVFNTEDGAMLSVGVSPYEQGETSALIAFEILRDHVNISDIPVVVSQQYVISMRKSALAKKGIRLPSIFEAFARATNNYFE